jgi:hypothetical protein
MSEQIIINMQVNSDDSNCSNGERDEEDNEELSRIGVL